MILSIFVVFGKYQVCEQFNFPMFADQDNFKLYLHQQNILDVLKHIQRMDFTQKVATTLSMMVKSQKYIGLQYLVAWQNIFISTC